MTASPKLRPTVVASITRTLQPAAVAAACTAALSGTVTSMVSKNVPLPAIVKPAPLSSAALAAASAWQRFAMSFSPSGPWYTP